MSAAAEQQQAATFTAGALQSKLAGSSPMHTRSFLCLALPSSVLLLYLLRRAPSVGCMQKKKQ
jgi:hypothetical protein